MRTSFAAWQKQDWESRTGPAAAAQAAPEPPIQHQGRSPGEPTLFPLSPAQKRVWFLTQLEPGRAIYNCPHVLRLQGALHLPALQSAFAELARRHEILRTVVEAPGGIPRQRVQPPSPVEVRIANIEALHDRFATALRLAHAEAA